MKLITRTDMTKHLIPLNPWPRWCFNLWCLGAGDLVAQSPDYCADFPRWKLIAWRIRGNVLQSLFHWWRYV